MDKLEKAKRFLVMYYQAKYTPGMSLVTLTEAGENLAEIVAELVEEVEAWEHGEA